MALESATFISQLVVTNPAGTDQEATLDNHVRLTKTAIKNSFPNVNSECSASSGEFNQLVGVTSNIQDQIGSASSALADVSSALSTRISTLSESLSAEISHLSTLSATFADTSAQLASAISTRIVKVSGATSGSFALLNSAGEVIEGGTAQEITAGTAVIMSPAQTSTATSLAHGLGTYPTWMETTLECLSAEYGYVVGQKISTVGQNDFTVWASSDSIGIAVKQNAGLHINRLDSADHAYTAIQWTNWKIVVTPFLLK